MSYLRVITAETYKISYSVWIWDTNWSMGYCLGCLSSNTALIPKYRDTIIKQENKPILLNLMILRSTDLAV